MKKKLVFPVYSAVALAVVALISLAVWGIDRYCERGNTIYISLLHLGLSDILMSMFFIGGGMLISAVALPVCKNFRFAFGACGGDSSRMPLGVVTACWGHL